MTLNVRPGSAFIKSALTKRLWIGFFVGGLVWGVQARHSAVTATADADVLLRQNSLTYEGFFKVPAGSGETQTTDIGGLCLAYDSSGNGGAGSLFICGKLFVSSSNIHSVAEVSIPGGISPSHTTLAQAPTANLLAGWGDPTNQSLASVGGGTSYLIGGILPYGSSDLLVSAVAYFGAPSDQKSITKVSRRLNSPTTPSGWSELATGGTSPFNCGTSATCRANFVNGAMVPIPSNYQASLGGDILAMNGPEPTQPINSAGPSLTAFHGSQVGSASPVPGRMVLGYPYGHTTLGDFDGNVPGNPWLMTIATTNFAAAWPTGTRSLLTFQTQSTTSRYCYGIPVGGTDGNGSVENPLAPTYDYGSGANASTSADGRTVNVPNAILKSVAFPGQEVTNRGDNAFQYTYIWLKEQASPVYARYSDRLYKGVSKIVGYSDSGGPNARVTVANPFPANLSAQDYAIGELTCYDPMGQGSTDRSPTHFHGPSAYPYQYSVWAYDANDLISVKNGSRKPWDVVPYDTWTFNLPLEYPAGVPHAKRSLGGAAYDPDHRKIYLVQGYTDSNAQAVITVWGVGTSGFSGSSLCFAAMFASWTAGSLIRRKKPLLEKPRQLVQ